MKVTVIGLGPGGGADLTGRARAALEECDLLVAVGMRFDDRVTGNPAHFGANAKVIHLEIDPAEPRYLKVVWGQGYKLEGGKP